MSIIPDGTRVRYTTRGGVVRVGTVNGVGEKDGELVYDVTLDCLIDGQTEKWGYASQFEVITR